jgi:predicted Rossmann-fold nucleotide-binding protein
MIAVCLNTNNKRNHLIPKIGVSGAADMGFLGQDVYEKAKELGREITRQGAIMMSGATTGFPYWAAVGCKEECGVSLGFSPAARCRRTLNRNMADCRQSLTL